MSVTRCACLPDGRSLVVALIQGFSSHHPNPQIPDDQLRRDSFLFYHPECETLAREVAEVSDGNVQLGRITWK